MKLKTQKHWRKHTLLALFSLMTLGSFCLVGCETTAGAGRDLEAAGEGIEDAAERTQPY